MLRRVLDQSVFDQRARVEVDGTIGRNLVQHRQQPVENLPRRRPDPRPGNHCGQGNHHAPAWSRRRCSPPQNLPSSRSSLPNRRAAGKNARHRPRRRHSREGSVAETRTMLRVRCHSGQRSATLMPPYTHPRPLTKPQPRRYSSGNEIHDDPQDYFNDSGRRRALGSGLRRDLNGHRAGAGGRRAGADGFQPRRGILRCAVPKYRAATAGWPGGRLALSQSRPRGAHRSGLGVDRARRGRLRADRRRILFTHRRHRSGATPRREWQPVAAGARVPHFGRRPQAGAGARRFRRRRWAVRCAEPALTPALSRGAVETADALRGGGLRRAARHDRATAAVSLRPSRG